MKISLDKLKAAARITLTINHEDTPVRGNALASGDAAEDKRCEDAILERLDRGDEYAWFRADVTAEYAGIECSSYLGCCSYRDEADFKNDAYYADMVDEALGKLQGRLTALAESIEALS